MNKRWIIVVGAIGTAALAFFSGWGCHPKNPGAMTASTGGTPTTAAATVGRPTTTAISAVATTRPATTTSSVYAKHGIRLSYPAGWVPRESKDYELLLVPAGKAGSGLAEQTITLDVPDLPPHLPGMIPMRLVKNGYLDDLKKDHGTIQTQDEAYPVGGIEGRLLVSHWEKEGRRYADIALVMIHADHVYILRAACDAAAEAGARAVFETIAKSVQWIK